MNIDDFASTAIIPVPLNGKMKIKNRQTKPFLKGPVPMDWLYIAGSLPGQCLQVGVVIWHEAGLADSRTIQFRPSKAAKFGMHRDTTRRALKRMQSAKLIKIHHNQGRCLEIQILDVESTVNTVVTDVLTAVRLTCLPQTKWDRCVQRPT